MDADGAGERVPGLALVEFGVGHAAKLGIGDPAQGEERARDAADLAQPGCERVLARVGAQPPQDQRSRDGAGAQRGREAAQLAPLVADQVGIESLAEQRRQPTVADARLEGVEAPVPPVPLRGPEDRLCGWGCAGRSRSRAGCRVRTRGH